MKYTLMSVSILAVILAFCIANTCIVDRISQTITSSIEKAEEEMEDGKAPEERCREIDALWQRRSRYLTSVTNHQTADDAEKEIKAMSAAAEKDNYEDFFVHSSQAKALLGHIGDAEKLRVSNIF